VQRDRLVPLAAFAAAMAYAEAAVVVYLRRALGVVDILSDVPPYDPAIALTEIAREAATLVMLLAAGWVAGRTRQTRIGFAFYAFGLWDILYYVWLRLLIGWPASLFAWDLLFLIPLPWWGPVLSPVLIALLCTAGGALAVVAEDRSVRARAGPRERAAVAAGGLAVLYAFMADALAALPAAPEELNALKPSRFPWPIYLAGLAAMTWAVARAVWLPLRGRREARRSPPAPDAWP
jgi:hypothetical protein